MPQQQQYMHPQQVNPQQFMAQQQQHGTSEHVGTQFGGAEAHIDTKMLSEQVKLPMTDPEGRITRRVVFQMEFSLLEADANPAVVLWTLQDDSILQRKKESRVGAKRHGDLSRVVLLDTKLMSYSSTVPKALILGSNQMRGNLYSNKGRGIAVIHPTQGPVVYENGLEVSKAPKAIFETAIAMYGHMNEEKIREGLTPHDKHNVYFVPIGHPVHDILKNNQSTIRINLDGADTVMGEVPIEKPIVDACIQAVKTKVFDRLPFVNLSSDEFVLSLSTVNGERFDSPSGISGIGSFGGGVDSRILGAKGVVTGELQLTYTINDASLY